MRKKKKKINATAVPALMGRLDSSMERVPEVGETNVAIMRDGNRTCSHWETGSYLYPRTQRKTVGVEYLSFSLVHIQGVS